MPRYFEHRQNGRRYVILSVDAEKNTMRLKGEFAEFDEPNDPAHFERMNYVLREGDPATDPALTAGSAAPTLPPAPAPVTETPNAPPTSSTTPPPPPPVPSVAAQPAVAVVPAPPPVAPSATVPPPPPVATTPPPPPNAVAVTPPPPPPPAPGAIPPPPPPVPGA